MEKKINILLLTSYFPPDNHVGSWRWERLVRCMPSGSFKFFVVTADNNVDYLAENKDLSSLQVVKRVSNLYGFSLRKLYKLLRKKKTVDERAKRISTTAVMKKSRFAHVRRWLSLVLDFPDFSWRGKFFLMAACEDILKVQKIDIIIASHPYALPLRCASLLSAKYGIPWIADMRDGWTGNLFSPYLDYPVLNYFLGLAEKKVLRSASSVVVINDELAKTIKCNESKKFVISNAFEKVNPRDAKKDNDGILHLVFTGGVKEPHFYRAFLDGLKLHNSHYPRSIVFDYFGRDFGILLRYARQINLDENVLRNNGYVANSLAQEASRKAGILVIFGWKGRFGETYQSGKIFDYLSAGRPVLGVDNTDSCLGKQISNCRLGLVTVTPQEIANFLCKSISSEFFLKEVLSSFDHNEIGKYSVDSTGKIYRKLIERVARQNGSKYSEQHAKE